MPQPPIQYLSLHVQTFRAFWDYFLYIKSFWTEWWGNRNIDNDKYAKIPIFNYRYIIKLNKLFACFSCKLIIKNECSVYIHSLDFPLIIYVTTNWMIPHFIFWSATGPISLFVVLALFGLLIVQYSPGHLDTKIEELANFFITIQFFKSIKFFHTSFVCFECRNYISGQKHFISTKKTF